MYDLAQRAIFLFIACHTVSASRWWRDTGYDGDLFDDSPEPTATLPPKAPYQRYFNAGTSPLNATIGMGIYPLLATRQLVGCRKCAQPNTICCNNGTFCCPSGVCQDNADWCCPADHTACPQVQNACVATGQTCCGSGACARGFICCGGATCCNASNSTCTEDGQCLSQAAEASISSVSLQSLQSLASVASLASQSQSSSSASVVVDPPSSSSSTGTTVVVDPPSSSSSTGATVVVDPPQTSSVSISNSPQTVVVDPPQTSSVSISDSISDSPQTVVPFDESATLDIPSSSFVDLPPSATVDPLAITADPQPSDDTPPDDTPPPDPNPPPANPPVQDADPSSSSTVVVETSVSSGVTLTVSHTVAPQILTGTAPTNTATATDAAQDDDSGDAVALVYPWDPRIQYDPESSWVSTTSDSSVGTCHNGTKVASQAGASIKFAFDGKSISVLTCQGSKSGDYSVQVDGAQGTTIIGYKDPGPSGDQCIISQTFNSAELPEGSHNISIIVKGASSSPLSGGASVEFGGFIYRGPNAYGTETNSKSNVPAIVGGTVGGVIGGILILTIIVVILIRRRRRNQRVDDAPAVHTIPVVTSGTPYSAVPTTEYHDPYASSGYGPNYYPNPTATPLTQPGPAWRQTNDGPFGDGSYAAGRI